MQTRFYACGGEKGHPSQIPLGIGYLMGFCWDHYPVHVEDSADLKRKDEYDVLCLSSPAWGLKEAVEIATDVRRIDPRIAIVLGGQGALWSGLKDYDCFDIIVHGEGELAFSMIIGANLRNAYSEIPQIIEGPKIPDLDLLAFPYRGKLSCGAAPILTSRGCPYRCSFCSSSAHWGSPRYRRPDQVIEEILWLADEYKGEMREVYIVDDLWMHPHERFEEFFNLWMSKGLQNRFSISGFARTNLIRDKQMIRDMKSMGFPFVRVGIETASNRLLKMVNKCVTVEDHQRLIDWAHECGTHVRGSFIRGLPTETEEDRKATADFKEKNKDKLQVMGDYTFRPFPGCDLYGGESPLESDMRVR